MASSKIHLKNPFRIFFIQLKTTALKALASLRKIFHETKTIALTSFTAWIDPKLAKYRKESAPKSESFPAPKHAVLSIQKQPQSPIPETTKPEIIELKTPKKPYTPKTTTEFLELLKRTPRNVIDQRERHVIATIINFPSVKVSELMLPPTAIVYVKSDEVLGPLTLDRLYRSGYQHFPVINDSNRIIGIIHTTALNSLEIKETSRAADILDKKICYLRDDYTLNQALAAFLRTNSYFFLVINRYEDIVGMLTYDMLVDYLLGETPTDDFDKDNNRQFVARRKI